MYCEVLALGRKVFNGIQYALTELAFVYILKHNLLAKVSMLDARYIVWETNADHEEIRNYYIGDSRDIAESLACKLYVKSEYRKDFMITVRRAGETEIHGSLFSEKTKRLRGECAG